MSTPATESPSPVQSSSEIGHSWIERRSWWVGFAALAAAWWAVFDCLRIEWSINEQYAYGWAVPWLALYLFYERWKRRPPAGEPRRRRFTAALLSLAALGWLPTHLLQVSSPDWRLIGWALAGLAIVLTLGGLYLAGGRAWLRHFAFPVGFLLIAVPWPVPFEQSIVQALMRAVARISVEALQWTGVPAIPQGNLIALGAGQVVGVEEACSGVRSFQTILMVALFVGELGALSWVRRVFLVVAGALVAFGLNVGRAFTLSALTAARGPSFVAGWHDAIGFTFLALTLLIFGGVAYWFRRRNTRPAAVTPSAPASAPRAIPWKWSTAFVVWLATVWGGVELWYRSSEDDHAPERLTVQWPETAPGFREIPLPSRTGVILRNDEGRSARWTTADGATWSMVYLRWQAGAAAVQLARAHTPEICLPAAGAQLERDRGVVPLVIAERSLPVQAYLFNAGSRPLHVFYLRHGEDGGTQRVPEEIGKLTARNRILAALDRRRNRGQQVIEVAIGSSKDTDEATADFAAFAQRSFRLVKSSVN